MWPSHLLCQFCNSWVQSESSLLCVRHSMQTWRAGSLVGACGSTSRRCWRCSFRRHTRSRKEKTLTRRSAQSATAFTLTGRRPKSPAMAAASPSTRHASASGCVDWQRHNNPLTGSSVRRPCRRSWRGACFSPPPSRLAHPCLCRRVSILQRRHRRRGCANALTRGGRQLMHC